MWTLKSPFLIARMRFFVECMKLVVEPAGNLAAAALLRRLIDLKGQRIGLSPVAGSSIPQYSVPALIGRFPIDFVAIKTIKRPILATCGGSEKVLAAFGYLGNNLNANRYH
jgi:hypothetical protein